MTSPYCSYLKSISSNTANGTDPCLPLHCLFCSPLHQPVPVTLILLFLEWPVSSPQGLCTCWSFCLASTFLGLIHDSSFLSFGSQLKGCLFRDPFYDFPPKFTSSTNQTIDALSLRVCIHFSSFTYHFSTGESQIYLSSTFSSLPGGVVSAI